MSRVLVAGVDSSTQSCKIVIRDAHTGELVRQGRASHPEGTEVAPSAWWQAFLQAVDEAGGLDDVSALAVGGQQHGMVCLDADGEVIRPALLWNDTRSAQAAEDLISELGGGDYQRGRELWAKAIGSVPVASLTVTKLRWLADHEPENASRIAAICLPHDWLTWKIQGAKRLSDLATDRSDASGTGYLDSVANEYRYDLLALALRRSENDVKNIQLPRLLKPNQPVGNADANRWPEMILGPGCGDNAGAALGLGLRAGEVSVSIGTSGVVAAVSDTCTHDPSGLVTGFADASGRFLPLACTLNGARILEAARRVLQVDYDKFDELALQAPWGANGLVHVPFLEGERTPNLPNATGTLFGMTPESLNPQSYARAAVEGLLCLMGAGMDAMRAQGVEINSVALIGGGANSKAVRLLAPGVLGVPVSVPQSGEYVANGAAKQAAWTLSQDPEPPQWSLGEVAQVRDDHHPEVRRAYDAAARLVAAWQA